MQYLRHKMIKANSFTIITQNKITFEQRKTSNTKIEEKNLSVVRYRNKNIKKSLPCPKLMH